MSTIGARRCVRAVVVPVAVALIAVTATACGGAASASPTGAPSFAATVAGPAELCATAPGVACELLAGDFKSTRFIGGATFRLIGDNSWTNVGNEPDVINLQIGAGGGFGQTGDPSSIVFVHGAPRIKGGEAFSDAEQAKTTLAAVAGLSVKTAPGSVIDGRGGVVFRVSNTSAAPVILWQYPVTTGAGTYDLPAGASAEVHWMTIDGVPVIVAFLAPGEGLDAFLLDGQAIIKSIRFG